MHGAQLRVDLNATLKDDSSVAFTARIYAGFARHPKYGAGELDVSAEGATVEEAIKALDERLEQFAEALDDKAAGGRS